MAPNPQSTISSGPAASAAAASRINQVHTTAEKAIRLPTERSMPAVMMTMVIPTARMAMTAIWLATFSRLSRLRKLGQLVARGRQDAGSGQAGKLFAQPVEDGPAAGDVGAGDGVQAHPRPGQPHQPCPGVGGLPLDGSQHLHSGATQPALAESRQRCASSPCVPGHHQDGRAQGKIPG